MKLLKFLGIIALVFLLGACGAAQGTSKEKKEIKIGYQKGASMLALKNNEDFISEVKEQGYTITWSEFNTGSSILEALNAGSVDFANASDMPSLFALAKESNFNYIAADASSPESEGILVRKDANITSLEELKGKKIAYNNASIAQYLLVKALDTVALTIEDVESVILAPSDASIAFEKGEVDAWVVWDPYMTVAESNGNVILQTAEGIVPHRSFYYSTPEMTEKYPELVELYIKYLNQIGEDINSDPKEVANILEEVTKVPADTWITVLQRKDSSINAMDEDAVKDLEKQAQDLLDIQLIDNKINFEGKIWYPE